eukprot:13322749-Alexandrium_andersonii.AAC.1
MPSNAPRAAQESKHIKQFWSTQRARSTPRKHRPRAHQHACAHACVRARVRERANEGGRE